MTYFEQKSGTELTVYQLQAQVPAKGEAQAGQLEDKRPWGGEPQSSRPQPVNTHKQSHLANCPWPQRHEGTQQRPEEPPKGAEPKLLARRTVG